MPGNQLWQLHVGEFSVDSAAGLPAELDGLSICHWSDLHLSGRIDRDYFHEVVRLTNEASVDVIALTGDICDKARYIDWICRSCWARPRRRLGKYFILGNHDLRTGDVGRLRGRDARGRIHRPRRPARWQLPTVSIVLAGNERPWFKPPNRNCRTMPPADEPLKILLAHTPDRFAWARSRGFDLMLAGHTHGGQIHLPVIGPMVCPSWHGTKYAAGFFHEPPTLLHVSRGTASLFPLRLSCPPEITKLVLRSGQV